MPKANRKEINPTPFPFPRQFTAPPFFTGLEDAKLRSQLLLAAVNSHAQTPGVPALPTHADSVAHLRSVFQHARRFARFGAGASGLVLGAQALSFATDRASHARVALGVSLSALYAYLLVDDARRWRRFSRRRENEAVRRLDAHQPQPEYVLQQLAMAAKKGR